MLKVSLSLTCGCGNNKSYEVEKKYHKEAHESYVDLTDAINGDEFEAKPTPDGTWVRCRNCQESTEII